MQSEDEREMCARTIYCTNIDKKVKWEWIVSKISWECNVCYAQLLLSASLPRIVIVGMKCGDCNESWALSVQ